MDVYLRSLARGNFNDGDVSQDEFPVELTLEAMMLLQTLDFQWTDDIMKMSTMLIHRECVHNNAGTYVSPWMYVQSVVGFNPEVVLDFGLGSGVGIPTPGLREEDLVHATVCHFGGLGGHWGVAELDRDNSICTFTHMGTPLVPPQNIAKAATIILRQIGWGSKVIVRRQTRSSSQGDQLPGQFTLDIKLLSSRTREGKNNCGPLALKHLIEKVCQPKDRGTVRGTVLASILRLLHNAQPHIVSSHENWQPRKNMMMSLATAAVDAVLDFTREPDCVVCTGRVNVPRTTIGMPCCGKRLHAHCQITALATRESTTAPNSFGLRTDCLYCRKPVKGFYCVNWIGLLRAGRRTYDNPGNVAYFEYTQTVADRPMMDGVPESRAS